MVWKREIKIGTFITHVVPRSHSTENISLGKNFALKKRYEINNTSLGERAVMSIGFEENEMEEVQSAAQTNFGQVCILYGLK